MTQYVMVTILSQALCEATINAIIAVGLTKTRKHELFSNIEKGCFKEKWKNGPKQFAPGYELKTDNAIYNTLTQLTKQRNALIHNKIDLHVDGIKILAGSKFERLTFKKYTDQMKRFFSLPYDLAEQAQAQLTDKSIANMVLYDRSPITRAKEHMNKKASAYIPS